MYNVKKRAKTEDIVLIKLYNHNIWGNFAADQKIGNRNKLIKKLIFDELPDFCCFQECNPTSSRKDDPIEELISEIYTEAPTEAGKNNFTPVFYNKERFSVVFSDWIRYGGLNDIDSKSITRGVFEEKSTGKRVAVFSTHFWWKVGEEHTLQRLENVKQLKAATEDIIERFGVPVIISGDLNNGLGAEQDIRPYEKLMSEGFTDIRRAASVTTDSHTCHAYPTLSGNDEYVNGPKPTFTLDYILTYGENALAPLKFEVLTSREALNSSDHCPLVGEFEF